MPGARPPARRRALRAPTRQAGVLRLQPRRVRGRAQEHDDAQVGGLGLTPVLTMAILTMAILTMHMTKI